MFSYCHGLGTKEKIWVLTRNQTSDLRNTRSDALALSHRDSTVSEVFFPFDNLFVFGLLTTYSFNPIFDIFLVRIDNNLINVSF